MNIRCLHRASRPAPAAAPHAALPAAPSHARPPIRPAALPAAVRLAAALLLTSILGPACTYIEERRDLMSGGPQRREAAAQTELDAERQRAAGLAAQKSQRERELDEVNGRLARAQAALDDQNRRLAAALKARQISQAKHDELKRSIDGLKSDASELRARNDADRVRRNGPTDAEKLKKLQELEQRRRDLETALQAAVRR